MNLLPNQLDLDGVSGLEALDTYPMFFRMFVQRKRQELVNPHFIGISEVILPRNVLIHHFPRNVEDYGPAISEAFISNYPDEVFIDFHTRFEPVIGSGRVMAFEVRKAIQSYRATHYKYSWTKDINTVYNRQKALIVKNYGLVDKLWIPRPTLFVNFERHYNRFNMLMDSVNEESAKGVRKQFLRIDLPLNVPGFKELLVDYDHYIKSFKNGLPVPNAQMMRVNKGEGSYWLFDLIAFLVGDYKYSLFNKLTEQSLNDLHLIFVSNSRCLIINMGIMKGWLDALSDSKVTESDKPESVREKHRNRFNVVKRVYLSLLTLTRNGISEAEVEEEKHGQGNAGEKDATLVEGTKGTQEEQGRASSKGRDKPVLGENAPVEANPRPSSLVDIFSNGKGSDDGSDDRQAGETAETNNQSVDEWVTEVDDELLEVEKISSEVLAVKDPFPLPESGVARALEERARDGNLSVAEQQFFMRKATQYRHIELENGQTLEEFMRVLPEEYQTLKADSKIEVDLPGVNPTTGMLQRRSKMLKQGYVEKFLHKDIVKMFVGLQNAGFALNDFKHEVIKGVEGEYDVYSVQYHEVNGEQSTHPIRFPRVFKDGTFVVDGVKSHMQLQRMEIPIRKINKHKVALTSYYDRRLMVQRSQRVVDDLGVWLPKQVLLTAKDNPNMSFSRGMGADRELVGPRIYSVLSSKFLWITVGETTLDFRINKLLETYPQFKKLTKKDEFLIGVKDNKAITVDSFGQLLLDGESLGTLESFLGVNTAKAPNEYAVINISGYQFPVGVVLCYYFGIDELLKVTKTTTRSVPMGNRPKLSEDEYAIAFNDEYLIFNRREQFSTLIFGGLPKLNNIGNFSRNDLNEKGIWLPLMADPKVRATQFQEMDNLFKLFIDPIHKEELIKRGYSDSFHYLLIDAVKLLETDYTRNEVELEEQRIVGYERFAGHLYRELCKANRVYCNKGRSRKHKLEINPEAIIVNIITDTSVNLVEDVNPVHQLKDKEEVTFGGVGGRSEITVTKRARMQQTSYKGKISEANKDSGKVGFVTYTTSDPSILDYRGNIDIKEKPTLAGMRSVTGNLMFGGSRDDTKRAVFTSTQASRAVAAVDYEPNITRTGDESLIGQSVSDLYTKVALEDGKVTNITRFGMEVTYNDGTTDRYPLGVSIGEASGEYHRHERVTDLKVGDSFKKGAVIGWNDLWFTRDLFSKDQVCLKFGRMIRVALLEDENTYEDSIAISKDMSEKALVPYIKPKRFVVEVDRIIDFKVKIGDIVDYDAILCDIEEAHLVAGADDTSLAENINRLGIKQIKAPHHGEVIKFDVIYNAPKETMSESVKKAISGIDKGRSDRAKFDETLVDNGTVNNTLNVNKPMLGPGKALFTVYIQSMAPSTTGDKYVFGNQMKGTVGGIMEKPFTTRSGLAIDAKMSFKGAFNRMVLSLRDKLASNEFAIGATKRFIEIYRGK